MTVTEIPSLNTTVQALSLTELADQPNIPCHTNPKTRREWLVYWNDTSTLRQLGGTAWFGGLRNFHEAVTLMTEGWSEGAARIHELSAEVKPTGAKSIQRKIAWRDDGDEICNDRLRSGNLDTCWRGSRRQTNIGPTLVTVNVNWGGLRNVTAKQMFWQGAAVCALVDALEEAGYRVRVIANNWSVVDRQANFKALIRVVIKDFPEPLQLDAMAAVLAHAGIYRTLGFMAKEQVRLQVDTGHGSTREITGELMEALNDGSEQSLILNKAYSREAAIVALKKVVSTLNGEQGTSF
jgi:hypothetical protein